MHDIGGKQIERRCRENRAIKEIMKRDPQITAHAATRLVMERGPDTFITDEEPTPTPIAKAEQIAEVPALVVSTPVVPKKHMPTAEVIELKGKEIRKAVSQFMKEVAPIRKKYEQQVLDVVHTVDPNVKYGTVQSDFGGAMRAHKTSIENRSVSQKTWTATRPRRARPGA